MGVSRPDIASGSSEMSGLAKDRAQFGPGRTLTLPPGEKNALIEEVAAISDADVTRKPASQNSAAFKNEADVSQT